MARARRAWLTVDGMVLDGGRSVRVREMEPGDAAAVLEVYAQGLDTGTATFETQVPDWPRWDAGHLPSPRPVAVDASPDGTLDGAAGLLGWAALSPVSDRCVYAGVAEVSLYVAERARGRGVGRLLLGELAVRSEELGLWTLQAGILAVNEASVALHRTAGFRVVGRRERLGRLDGHWHDVLLLERRSAVAGVD